MSRRFLTPFTGVRTQAQFCFAVLFLAAGPVAATADFRRGDFNADGVVDVADVNSLLRYLFITGNPSTCQSAGDANDDGRFEIIDAIVLFSFLYFDRNELPSPGSALPGPDPTPGIPCDAYDPQPPAKKADFALRFLCEEPPPADPGETVRLEVFVQLLTENNSGASGAQAWSLSIKAEDLRILDVTTEGTSLPLLLKGEKPTLEKHEVVDPLLDTGFGPQGEGAVSAVIVSSYTPTALPPTGVARLLQMTVETTVPAGGLGALGLSFADGMTGSGKAVRNIVSLDGIAHSPAFGGCQILFPDCNDNEVPDSRDISQGTSRDCDGNSIPDECD